MDAMDDEQLRLLIQKVARRIRSNRAGDDLSDSQLSVLFQLEKGNHSPGELAAHERVTPPSMNRTLNGLERDGFIARTPSPDDARKVRVGLTQAGLQKIVATRALRSAWFARQLAGLTPGERRALDQATPVLRKLAEQ